MKLRKVVAAGMMILGLAGPASACYLQTGVSYAIQGGGTGSVGPFVNGNVTFNSDGTLTGNLYGHWYGHGECVINWEGTYTDRGTVLTGGITYNADIVATGDCLPKNGYKNQLILIPKGSGTEFYWGTYKANSNTWGTGKAQE